MRVTRQHIHTTLRPLAAVIISALLGVSGAAGAADADPAGAVTPSSLKENEAVTPSSVKENEAISPSSVKGNKAISPSSLEGEDQAGTPGNLKENEAVTPSSLKGNKAVSPSDLKERKLPAVQNPQPASGEPEMLRVSPDRGEPGTRVRIEGRYLGPERGDRGLYIVGDERGHDMPIRRWSDDEIVAVISPHADPGESEIRLVPRSGDTIVDSIPFEVVASEPGIEPRGVGEPGGDRFKAPEGVGEPSVPRPKGPGGRSGGGLVRSCDGPDPAAEIAMENIRRDADGSYSFDVVATIRNVGREDFRSGAGQQTARLLQGSRTLETSSDWSTLFVGTSGSTRHTVTGWRPGSEFLEGFRVRIDYDPDIFQDGNPDNDDCNLENNEAELSVADIESELDRHSG